MAFYKKKKPVQENENLNNEEKQENQEEKFDPNGMETVVNRVKGGLVGEYKIQEETLNKPMFKKGDLVCFRAPARLQKGDFVLYLIDPNSEDFAIRRIIKFIEDDIYVAGDNESEYHIIHREDVVGKAISRERKNKWLTLTGFSKKKRFYVFKKVNLAKLRLGNRIRTNEDDINSDALEVAMQNVNASQQQVQEKPKYVITIDLDSDLAAFLNPDDLAKEWLESEKAEVKEIYVDEYGNPISQEEYEAAISSQEGEDFAEEENSESEEVVEEEVSEDEDAETSERETEVSNDDIQVGLVDEDL